VSAFPRGTSVGLISSPSSQSTLATQERVRHNGFFHTEAFLIAFDRPRGYHQVVSKGGIITVRTAR